MTELRSEVLVGFSSGGNVGHIVFNRPPANAYDLTFHEQFNEAIDAAELSDARAIILVSALERFFCAGADIKAFASNSTADNKAMVASAQQALSKIEGSPKAYIACIAGHCLGGGLEIAMACDIRFGSEGAYKLGLPEARLGLLPGNGGSQRLPRLVGPSQAFVMLASGESIGPEEALRIGLLNQVFPEKGAMLQHAESLANSIAHSAPLAVAASKRAVNDGLALPLKEALRLEAELLESLYETDDAKEGFNAFVEKRQPRYHGK
ncbi:MAG: enoyl-CoA hydratase-related protein [Verrucomicrobiota bacterium]